MVCFKRSRSLVYSDLELIRNDGTQTLTLAAACFIALPAPAVLVLLLAFPLRQGSLAWFGAVESGFISLIGLLWAYGLFIAPSLAANVRTDSPSLYDLAGAAYIYAGLPLLGILLIALALRYRHDPASGRESGCDAQDGERSPATRSERTGGTE